MLTFSIWQKQHYEFAKTTFWTCMSLGQLTKFLKDVKKQKKMQNVKKDAKTKKEGRWLFRKVDTSARQLNAWKLSFFGQSNSTIS